MDMKHLLKRYDRRPEFEFERLPTRRAAVTLNGDTGGFFAYKVGDRFLWMDYDYPGGGVKQYYDCGTRARFWVNGQDCLELHEDYYERKKGRFRMESQSDRYVSVGERDVAELLWVHRAARPSADKGAGNIQFRQIVTPRRIRLGDRWRFVERHFWRQVKSVSHYTSEADGLFRVWVFGRKHDALRIRLVGRGKERSSMSYSYVSLDTGLTVFFRRYNGPGWKNLDKLANEEKVVIGRTAFLHWYDSVPFRE